MSVIAAMVIDGPVLKVGSSKAESCTLKNILQFHSMV